MKRTTLTLLAAMSTTVVLAACSDENSGGGDGGNAKADEDPKTAVMQAFENTNDAKTQTTTMSLDVDEELIRKALDASASGGASATDQANLQNFAELLPKTKVTIAQHSRDQALAEEKDLKDLDTAMTLHVGEGKVEIRMVEGGMYMRADVDKLGQETGLFTADQLRMGITGGQSVPADDPNMQFLNKALEGEWIGITPEKMNELVGENGMSLEDLTKDATGAQADISPEKQAEIQQDLKGFMDKHGEFTKEGDNVRVSIPVEKSWDDFAAIVNKSVTDPSEKMPALDEDTKKAIKDDAKAFIDIGLDGDQLKSMKVDFRQFVDWIDPESMEASDREEYQQLKDQLGDSPLGMTVDYTQGDAPAKPDQFAEVPQEMLDASQSGMGNPGAPVPPADAAQPSTAAEPPAGGEGLSEEEMAELDELIAELEQQQAEASNG
ncbi:hypothetical protein [Kytococcus sedentarius]|uniref:hypothetical protein n=1 Tax=Kytococcus sedentarius TaxID=1276 RepID=UPI0035BC30AA